MFETSHLLTLQTAAKLGSFAAAAHTLNFTPSAVSQQMAALERLAGATLFERGHAGARLTEAGEALLLHAEVVLARLALAELELKAIADRQGSRLRFGSFTSATATFAAEALERFREQHPAVGLTFFDGEPYESAARLKARELDLAVVFDLDVWATGTTYDGRAVCDDDALECVGGLQVALGQASVEPSQQPLGFFHAAGDRLGPRERCDRLVSFLCCRLIGLVEQLQGSGTAVENRARGTERPVVGASPPQPGARELERLSVLQQRRGAVERRLCLLAAPAPSLGLAELEP